MVLSSLMPALCPFLHYWYHMPSVFLKFRPTNVMTFFMIYEMMIHGVLSGGPLFSVSPALRG